MKNNRKIVRSLQEAVRNVQERTTHLGAIQTQISSVVDSEVQDLMSSGNKNTAISAIKSKGGVSRSEAEKLLMIYDILKSDTSVADGDEAEALARQKVERQSQETSAAHGAMSPRQSRNRRRKRRFGETYNPRRAHNFPLSIVMNLYIDEDPEGFTEWMLELGLQWRRENKPSGLNDEKITFNIESQEKLDVFLDWVQENVNPYKPDHPDGNEELVANNPDLAEFIKTRPVSKQTWRNKGRKESTNLLANTIFESSPFKSPITESLEFKHIVDSLDGIPDEIASLVEEILHEISNHLDGLNEVIRDVKDGGDAENAYDMIENLHQVLTSM